jgi:hypothetical protein
MEDLIKVLGESLLQQYPIPLAVLTIVGALRLIMKPLFELLKAITQVTPSPRDNELLAKVMDSKVYKTLSFVLDWIASVKMPK